MISLDSTQNVRPTDQLTLQGTNVVLRTTDYINCLTQCTGLTGGSRSMMFYGMQKRKVFMYLDCFQYNISQELYYIWLFLHIACYKSFTCKVLLVKTLEDCRQGLQ